MALYLADRRDKARWVLDFTSGHGRYITAINTAGFVLTPNWAVGGDLAGVTSLALDDCSSPPDEEVRVMESSP